MSTKSPWQPYKMLCERFLAACEAGEGRARALDNLKACFDKFPHRRECSCDQCLEANTVAPGSA